MSSISTHVLDTAHGRPANGVAVALTASDGSILFEGVTNADGRCAGMPMLDPGRYALRFAVADYFRAWGVTLAEPPFLDVVTIDFGMAANGQHYHVPLLVSPYSYSTYRGS
jgi:5-hydroxyisourate hydrolase